MEWEGRRVDHIERDIDLSRFPEGLYFLTVRANRQWHTEKIVLVK